MSSVQAARAKRIACALVVFFTHLWPHSTATPRDVRLSISHDAVHPTELVAEYMGHDWRQGGTVHVSARLMARNVLDSMELWQARDADANGAIDSHEWQRVGIASIREQDGETIAVISKTSLPEDSDGYGLLLDMTNAADSYDEFVGRVDVDSFPEEGGWAEIGND